MLQILTIEINPIPDSAVISIGIQIGSPMPPLGGAGMEAEKRNNVTVNTDSVCWPPKVITTPRPQPLIVYPDST